VRRTVAFVALWFVAGAAAATVAWLGVSVVSEQLAGSGSHPDPLSAEEIRAEVATESTTTTATSTVPPSSPTTTPPPPPSTPTTTGSPGTTTPSPTTTTTAPAPSSTTKSYDLVGGDVTLRFSPSGVTVVVASPAVGFTVDIGESHDGGARVEFESDDHRSRLDAWWDGGPQDEVREDD
jgi:cytoskeletal protein RodZ